MISYSQWSALCLYIHQGGFCYVLTLRTHTKYYVNLSSICNELAFHIAIATVVKTINLQLPNSIFDVNEEKLKMYK